MTKCGVWFSLLLLAMLPAWPARAQTPVSTLEQLGVAIWPDYDRPSVLVMFTGTLPADEPLPAVVTVPFPADAQLNAVARIDAQQRMIDDILYNVESGRLTLTTPDPRFHVEYYLPYQIEAGERSFAFTWKADLSVRQLQATVQQPAGASSLATEPLALGVAQGADGLAYHRLPGQAVPSGQPFSIQVRYPMATNRLSVELRASPPGAPVEKPASAPAPTPSGGFGYLAVAAVIAGALIAALVSWQIARSRSQPSAEGGAEASESPRRQFCHSCGGPVAREHRFCSGCGASLRDG
jgi:hypothetical protein